MAYSVAMRDDYRIDTGPGWLGVILTSLITSCGVLIAFVWALQHGLVHVPALDQKAQGGASAAGSSAHVSVPSLVGLPTSAAIELLGARGLRLVVRQKRANAAPVDVIIAQDPLADSRLARDAEVAVVLSSGPAAAGSVPSLVGKPLLEAVKELEAAGFKASDVPADAGEGRVVVATEPAAGKPLERGGLVKLQLAPAGVALPKLTGMSLTKAKKAITELGLSVGKLRSRYDEDIQAYEILAQTPAEGTVVAPGTPVELVYSEE
jgi:beta-lactam-binding protein with PASTA domain